ncbi:uncharacterized protein METZ01_LOCUS365670, partial [marine metagenome]
MVKTRSLLKSCLHESNLNALKVFLRLLGLFVFVFACLSSKSFVEANEFELTLKELGSKSRSQIKIAVKTLGELGNPAALPALNALKSKRLAMTINGKLVILNESEDQARDALSGEKLDIKISTLRKPRINNSVRRHLSTAIAKLKLNSENSLVRLEAAQDLLKRSSSTVLPLVEASLKKETNDNVKEVLLLVLAKLNLQGEDKNKRLESLNAIKNFGGNNFYSVLEELLIKNEKGEFLEKDSEIRDLAVKAIESIKQRQIFIDQVANLFYGLSL